MSTLKKCAFICLFISFFASNASALVTILSPTENQAFYGSTITLSVKLQHTPNYDVGVHFQSRQLYIPGQWPDSWTSESVQILGKNEISPGITLMNVAIPKGGSWRMSASEQPKVSPKPGASSPWREFAVIAPGQNTVASFLSASPTPYSGKCPVQIYFKGRIGSAVKGTVNYVFIRSWDSVTTPVQTLQFDGPGYIEVSTNFPVDPLKVSSIPSSGWVAIKIPGNPDIISNHADYNVTCKYPDLEMIGISGISALHVGDTTSYTGWKVKVRNKGTGDAEPMDIKVSCEPVDASGPAGETPSCPDMFKYMAYSLGKLEAGKEDERGFWPTNFTEKWQAGKYRIIAEADSANKIADADKSNNKKIIEVTAQWTPITDVQIKWAGHNYKGLCPANDIELMSGELTANGLGKVKFQYINNSGPSSGTHERIFSTPGEKLPIGIKTATTATTPNTSGWYQVRVLSPIVKESSQVPYTIECLQASISPDWIKNIKSSFAVWKSLEKFSQPPQTCQGCLATHNRILVLDQVSLPLMQEGENLMQQIPSSGQDQTKVKRLDQIKSQLDTNMIQRKSLVSQLKTQLLDFERLQKQPVTPLQRKGLNPQPEPPITRGR